MGCIDLLAQNKKSRWNCVNNEHFICIMWSYKYLQVRLSIAFKSEENINTIIRLFCSTKGNVRIKVIIIKSSASLHKGLWVTSLYGSSVRRWLMETLAQMTRTRWRWDGSGLHKKLVWQAEWHKELKKEQRRQPLHPGKKADMKKQFFLIKLM